MQSVVLQIQALALILRPWPSRTGSRWLDVLVMLERYGDEVRASPVLQRDLTEIRDLLDSLVVTRHAIIAEADHALSRGDSTRAAAILAETRDASASEHR